MNKIETAGILKILSSVFSSLRVTPETVEAWHQCFSDEQHDEVLRGVKFLIKSAPREFVNPSHVFDAMRRAAGATVPNATIAWQQQGRVAGDDIAAQAWRIWGGDRRHNMGVDISSGYTTADDRYRYNADKKEFVEIYNGLVERAKHERAIGINRTESTEHIDNATQQRVRKLEVLK